MSDRATRFTIGKDLLPGPNGRCDACQKFLNHGERVYYLAHLATPWMAEDDENNSWSGHVWHIDCDEGSLAADGAV